MLTAFVRVLRVLQLIRQESQHARVVRRGQINIIEEIRAFKGKGNETSGISYSGHRQGSQRMRSDTLLGNLKS